MRHNPAKRRWSVVSSGQPVVPAAGLPSIQIRYVSSAVNGCFRVSVSQPVVAVEKVLLKAADRLSKSPF